MENAFPRGSEWRKWDLHFHTPASYEYGFKPATDAQIVETLVQAGIAAVAITDHHHIDVDRIKSLQTLGAGRLTVFPGIEFRSELGGSELVHFIGLFPETCDLSTLWMTLRGRLELAPAQIQAKGEDNVFHDFKETATLIHELGGLVSIHAGSKSNSIERITNAVSYKMAIKQDVANSVDIFEVGKLRDIDEYRERVFPHLNTIPPLIITSDNHDIRSYRVRENCWIKADPTFLGLRRILVEPVDRVFVGTEPPKRTSLREDQSRCIDRIHIHASSDDPDTKWFDDTLPLNPGLIAIVGKKGSGKSALADTIGLAGGSHVLPEDYSFLNKDKFRKRGLAGEYSAEQIWAGGNAITVSLDNEVDPATEVEQVRYLPQRFVETICTKDGVSEGFQREIDKVVFAYVPESEQLEAADLRSLLDQATRAVDDRLGTKRYRLSQLIEKRLALEQKQLPRHAEMLQNSLKAKNDKLKSLVDPPKVAKPAAEPDEATKKQIESINAQIAELSAGIEKAEKELSGISKQLTAQSRVSTSLESLKSDLETLRSSLQDDLAALDLKFDDILKVAIDDKRLTQLGLELKRRKEAIQKDLGSLVQATANLEQDDTSLKARERVLQQALKNIQRSLDAENRAYELYLQETKKLETARQALRGRKGTADMDTIHGLETELAYVKDTLPADLKSIRTELSTLCKEIFDTIASKEEVFKGIYKPLIDFTEAERMSQVDAQSVLSFDVGIVSDRRNFERQFLSLVDQSRDGTFQGKQQGATQLKDILNRHALDTSDHVLAFIEDVLGAFSFDRSAPGESKPRVIDDQLISRPTSKSEMYGFLYGLGYLDVKYKILFNGKDLNQDEFSPGERGAILLIFYLLIDKEQIPLVIDQPEENLDNESVYSLLVPYVRRAKQRRQIIVVTHNPNIAVVCDAEQIVHASMDKSTNQIRYTSGSIECPDINKKIVDILEGTRPAFDKRHQSYPPNSLQALLP